ncbi:MAG: IclR family transcriptional regulator [Pseudomonadota bacterium]|nr:IclR family transcriptional regulator [Pseudomonadota bacterium]
MDTKARPVVPAVKRQTPSGRLSSVTSALLVLKVFADGEAELGISSIAQRLGLAKSTVHRLAATLAGEGFLEQNSQNGRYRLGLSLFSLGALVRQRMDVSNQAHSLLGALRDQTQETVHLAILDGACILYLYNMESAQAIGTRSYIGTRKPAFCTSEGRVLLAFHPPELTAAVLKEELVQRTPKTTTNVKQLRVLLEQVRLNGYSTDDEESEIGMRSVAAPIRDISGMAIAAVGLAGPIQRLTKKELRRLVPQVMATASAVSVRMGYRTPSLTVVPRDRSLPL